MYLTYSEYKDMGGSLSATAFETAEYEAELIINRHTFNRLHKESEYSRAVKLCVFKLIGYLQQIGERQITSQSNDGVSVSYAQVTTEDTETLITKTVRTCLACEYDSDGEKLLYRGV